MKSFSEYQQSDTFSNPHVATIARANYCAAISNCMIHLLDATKNTNNLALIDFAIKIANEFKEARDRE